MRVQAALIEIWKRFIKVDEKKNIFFNGLTNDYPERIERYINNSATAKPSASKMVDYLVGLGFGEDENKIKVTKDKTLLQLTQKTARSMVRQRGIFLHINYDGNYDINYLEVLPFAHCRIGKKDDDDYSGTILVSADWTKSDDDAYKPKEFNVYNPEEKIIKYQVSKAKGKNEVEKFKNYKGQVLYVDMDGGEAEYPLSTIDAVKYDCESEHHASLYKNGSLRKGWFGKTLVVTPPMVDAKPEDGDEAAKEWDKQTGEREAFRKTLKEFIGAENVEGILHLELEFDTLEELDKSIMFKNIEANIDDKLFAFTESSVSNNIRYAFNNIPALLVRDNVGSLFGQSGEGIKAAKEYYQEQTTQERLLLVQILTALLSRHINFKGKTLTHIPLIEVDTEAAAEEPAPGDGGKTKKVEPDNETKKAQAALRGSVGGVTGILNIQTSVKEGKTDRDSALTILVEIYGFTKDVAEALLGEVEEEEETE